MTSKTYAEILAEFAAGVRFEEIPSPIVETAKLSIMDNVGCILAARDEASVKIVVDMVRTFGGTPQSSIIGYWEKVPAPWAAYCNGVANHSLELDDHIAHTHSLNHPGVVSVPPALAVGEYLHTNGQEFITSVVLGYEVTNRINATVPPGFDNFERGFHGTAVFLRVQSLRCVDQENSRGEFLEERDFGGIACTIWIHWAAHRLGGTARIPEWVLREGQLRHFGPYRGVRVQLGDALHSV